MSEQKDRLDLLIKQVFEKMKSQHRKLDGCPDEELLVAYGDGSLMGEERERLEEHLTFCTACAESLLAFSDPANSPRPGEETYTTQKMLKQAKSLVEEGERRTLWVRIYPWLTSLRLKPVMIAASALLVVMVFGLFRMQTPPSDTPLPARFGLIARIQDLSRGTSEDYREVDVEDGGVLHSGDLIKITFKLQEEAYIYLLFLDSTGKLSKLFPDVNGEPHEKLKAGQFYQFPGKGSWLKLDQNTGKETIYLIASKTPIENIDREIDALKRIGIDKITELFPNTMVQPFRFQHK